jgi:hypothetical protein
LLSGFGFLTDHLAYLAEGHVSYFHNLVSVLVSFLQKKQNKTDKNLINILIFFCKTWESKGTKLARNVHWMVLYQSCVFGADLKSNMAARVHNVFSLAEIIDKFSTGPPNDHSCKVTIQLA